MADDRIHALPAVRRRLGNPVARVLLQFVIRDDDCGNRLENAIRYYPDPADDLCWKCRLAGRMVGHTLRRSSDLFRVSEDDIRRGLTETFFLRGLQNVLEGIARYGITMPQVVNAPFMVVWDFTHRCNLRCAHCYPDAQKVLPHELDTDEAKRLVEELADAGVVVIAFSGGEPLMRKEALSTAPQVAPVALADEGGVPVGHFYAGEAIEGKTGLLADEVGGCGAGRLYLCGVRGA